MRVLLTAGFDKAPHVLGLAELLRRRGDAVVGILVVSPFNVTRVRQMVRQRGSGFLVSAARRLFGRSSPAGPQDPLARFLQENAVAYRSLRVWAKQYRVPYRTVSDLNHPEALQFVQASGLDVVFYGGGGILKKAFINAAGGMVLNAHSGPLPHVRGMNACEWSLILGHEPTVTIHLIDVGIDTGPSIRALPVRLEAGDGVERLRSKCAVLGIRGLLDVRPEEFEQVNCTRSIAVRSRQCFVMAPVVVDLLRRQLAQYSGAQ